MVAELRKLDGRSAADLRRMERSVARDEARKAWGQVQVLTGRGHLSVVAERPDLSMDTFARIRSIAERSLRQLEGGDAA
jgi:hypothetical protein